MVEENEVINDNNEAADMTVEIKPKVNIFATQAYDSGIKTVINTKIVE